MRADRRNEAQRLPRVARSASLVGAFDAIDHGYAVAGWVHDLAAPRRQCLVELRIGGRAVEQRVADLPRPDLRAARIPPESGFRFTLPASAFDGVIRPVEVVVLPEGLRIGEPRPVAAVLRDTAAEPWTFSVDSILGLRDGALDHDRIVPPAFLARHGARAAVAYAYLWLLKRPPDRADWEHYSERILSGELSIGSFLRDLAASEEARRARRSGIDLAVEFEAVLALAARLPIDPPD